MAIFKDNLLRAYEWSILLKHKWKKVSSGLDSTEKEVHKRQKWVQTRWQEYRHTDCLHRNRVRKAKAQLKLKLARELKNSKKWFLYTIRRKRAGNVVGSVFGWERDLVIRLMEKSQLLCFFFFSSNKNQPVKYTKIKSAQLLCKLTAIHARVFTTSFVPSHA